jgi:hypothetical protein
MHIRYAVKNEQRTLVKNTNATGLAREYRI